MLLFEPRFVVVHLQGLHRLEKKHVPFFREKKMGYDEVKEGSCSNSILEMPMNLDAKVCYCFHVTQRKLVNFLRLRRPKVASQLSECGGAGTGCGWCIPFLKQLHQQAMDGGQTELEILTPAEYEHRRAAYVRAGFGTPPPGATPLPPQEELSG